MHIALCDKRFVECVCARERLRGVPHRSVLDEFAEQVGVLGVGAVFDEDFGAFVGGLAAKVGNTVFGDDDV